MYAIGMSVAPPNSLKSSSSLFKSTIILPPTFPTDTALTKSFIGIPACAKAMLAAVIPAHLVPELAWIISINTSITEVGYILKSRTGNKAFYVTREISVLLLFAPGFFLSLTEKEKNQVQTEGVLRFLW